MRKTREIEERPRHVRIMSGATLGVCVGCAAALPATLFASRLLAPHVADIDSVHQWTFYVLLFGCVALAWRLGAQRAAIPLLWLAATCNALIPAFALLHGIAPEWVTASMPNMTKAHHANHLLLEGLCALLALFFGWLAVRHKKKNAS